MDKREAAVILGLREGSLTKDKIKNAHRRMMIANHPDRGGSPYLASSTFSQYFARSIRRLLTFEEINEAKDLLDKNTPR